MKPYEIIHSEMVLMLISLIFAAGTIIGYSAYLTSLEVITTFQYFVYCPLIGWLFLSLFAYANLRNIYFEIKPADGEDSL